MMILKRGQYGERVKDLQRTLSAKGYKLDVDGTFGSETEALVVAFQSAVGIEPDGEVGPDTQAALRGHIPPAPAVVRDFRDLPLTRRAVMELAFDFLGAREVAGTNKGPEIEQVVGGYEEYIGVAPGTTGPAWCAIFISSVIRQALGYTDWTETPMKRWIASAYDFEQWAKKEGIWSDEPLQGAVAVMKYLDRAEGHGYSGHVGLVVDERDGVVVTIDGNVSDKVALRERPHARYRGFVHWWDLLPEEGEAEVEVEAVPGASLADDPIFEYIDYSAEDPDTDTETDMNMELISPERLEELKAVEARYKEEVARLDRAQEALKAARKEKRQAKKGPAKDVLKEIVAKRLAEKRQEKSDAKEAKSVLRDLERELGIRPGNFIEFLLGKFREVVVEELKESFPEIAELAVEQLAARFDFAALIPGKVGQALEAVDDQAVNVIAELIEASEDGLQLAEVVEIAKDVLEDMGVSFELADLVEKAKTFF